jgi:hypothetical protein
MTTAAEKAGKKYKDSKALFERNKDFISQSELDQDQQDSERTAVALERAQVDRDIFEEYTLPMTTRDKQVAVETPSRARHREQSGRVDARQKQVRSSRTTSASKMNNQPKERRTSSRDGPEGAVPGTSTATRYSWDQNNFRRRRDLGRQHATIPDLRIMQESQIHQADINKIKTEWSRT